MDVVVGVVDVVVVVVWCLGLVNALWKCWDDFDWESWFFMPCSELQTAITLWILGLKICGLLFWIAYDVSYKFDVSSFRI